MCGIAGLYVTSRETVDSHAVAGMIDRIAHRGPDGRGIETAPHIGFGHVRLSILDLSELGSQPMWSHDRRYLLTYNGEVYNFRALRTELEAKGIFVRSTGDTEVLVEYLAHFGVDATLPRLEGFWAFALWDTVEQTLVLSRDRYGIKPLYYSIAEGTVQFASELKALAGPGVRPDATTLQSALLGFSATWGTATMFENVAAVEPGCTVTFRRGFQPRHRRWFSMTDLIDPALARELDRLDDDAVVDRIASDFGSSMDYRMISDAPVACLASGGVDSSLVSALALQREPSLALFHADVQHDSERPAAEELARHVGRELHVAAVTDADYISEITNVTWFNDLPLIYHLNSVPFHQVCQLAGSEGVKVLLTGEGSDEYFLGYPQFAFKPYLDAIESAKRFLRDGAHRVASKPAQMFWPKTEERFPEQLRLLVSRFEDPILDTDSAARLDHLPADEQRAALLSLRLSQAHLTSLLHRNDRLGMAAGLESRFPFLGHDLTKVAVNLPSRHKLRWSRRFHNWRHPFITDKWAVRELAARSVPRSLSHREKRGFPVWIFQRMHIDSAYLHDGFVADTFGLDRRAIAELERTATDLWMMRLMLLEVWGQLFIHGSDRSDVQAALTANITVDAH